MKKFLIIGIASAALSGFANVNVSIAQTGAPPPPAPQTGAPSPPAPSEQRMGPTDNQIANEVDARIAQLKANLSLTADQEKNWPGLQSALHDDGMAQFKDAFEGGNRPSRRDQQQGQGRPNDIALMRTMADDLTARGAALKKLADAAEPLYGSLDDRQKNELIRFLRITFERRRR
jgi:hypothetical protein